MSCVTYADVDAELIAEDIGANPVTANYYPQVLTGYNTGTTTRTPSEDAVVEVDGIFEKLVLRAADDTIARSATFTFAYSADLGFSPTALDRLVIDTFSYRATQVDVAQNGGTPTSYTLTLASD